jgi:hypothetical protein
MNLYVSDHVNEYSNDEICASYDATKHREVRFVLQQMHQTSWELCKDAKTGQSSSIDKWKSNEFEQKSEKFLNLYNPCVHGLHLRANENAV